MGYNHRKLISVVTGLLVTEWMVVVLAPIWQRTAGVCTVQWTGVWDWQRVDHCTGCSSCFLISCSSLGAVGRGWRSTVERRHGERLLARLTTTRPRHMCLLCHRPRQTIPPSPRILTAGSALPPPRRAQSASRHWQYCEEFRGQLAGRSTTQVDTASILAVAGYWSGQLSLYWWPIVNAILRVVQQSTLNKCHSKAGENMKFALSHDSRHPRRSGLNQPASTERFPWPFGKVV